MGDLIFSYREDKCGVKDQIKKKDSLSLSPKPVCCKKSKWREEVAEKGDSR